MRWRHGLWTLAILAGLTGPARPADIRSTPHGMVLPEAGKKNVDPKEICVFCHTPDLSQREIPARPPQWQSSIGRDYTFTIYDDIGRLGLDRSSVGSQSIACLSCHDSNQALSASKTSDDHPFGVPYRGAIKYSPKAQRDAARQPDKPGDPPHRHAALLVGLDDFRDVSHGTIENRSVWWVSRQGMTARRSRNDLPLYSRMDDDSGLEVPHIECSSCHDPHSPNDLFLRVKNDGSALCLTCHDK